MKTYNHNPKAQSVAEWLEVTRPSFFNKLKLFIKKSLPRSK